MFSRIKGAIDRSIAEEQARQRAFAEQRSNTSSPSGSGQRPRSVSRTNSTNSAGRKKAKKLSQDISNGDGAANPDPAVFEAAFVLDDEDAEAGSSQPQSAPPEKGLKDGLTNSEKKENESEQNGETKDPVGPDVDEKSKGAPSNAPTELPSHIKIKLKKLEKLEATYPG
ncbi:hypothetical protein F5Y06DRAFT_265278 [Hypoxylon sp. FL0890]|nr:hypothetical protein F5Y06DRAFT_265278 [Hypoxylon sp. FL0890]